MDAIISGKIPGACVGAGTLAGESGSAQSGYVKIAMEARRGGGGGKIGLWLGYLDWF